uniref:Calponin-homology (CH) domain-containing protein n=1 Tax=Parastrongyloides trichosuri TaxID=131310 RepID=A0A0N4ZZ86_PARTI
MSSQSSSKKSSNIGTPKSSRKQNFLNGASPISVKRKVLTESRNLTSKTPSCTERRKQYAQDLHARLIKSVAVKKFDKENDGNGKRDIKDLCTELNSMKLSHHTATEELQATAEELHDLKELVHSYEHDLATLNDENEKLKDLIRVYEMEKDFSIRGQVNGDGTVPDYKGMYFEKCEENVALKGKITSLKESLKREKSDRKQFGADMLVVVKAANRMREEAEEELSKVLNRRLSFRDKRRKSEIEEARDIIVASHLAKIDDSSRESIGSSISDCVFVDVKENTPVLNPACEKIRRPRSSFTPHKVAGVLVTNPAEEAMWNDLLKNKSLMSRRNALLSACHELLGGYIKTEDLTNFSSCWNNGKAFAYLLIELVDDKDKLPFTVEDIKLKRYTSILCEVLKACKNLGMSEDMLEKEEELRKEYPDWRKVMRLVVNIIVFIKYTNN